MRKILSVCLSVYVFLNCCGVRLSFFKNNKTVHLLLSDGPSWDARCLVCFSSRGITCVNCRKCQ